MHLFYKIFNSKLEKAGKKNNDKLSTSVGIATGKKCHQIWKTINGFPF